MLNSLIRLWSGILVCAIIAVSPARASEGFWLLNRPPLDAIEKETGVRLDPDWLRRASRSTLRTPGWCTSSFVSPSGLALTNHHCLVACLSQNPANHNYLEQGFLADNRAAELPCRGTELDQIIDVTDVTDQVLQALSTATADDYGQVKQMAIAAIESSCARPPDIRCEVLGLADAGHFDLYKYRIYRDVRLVFAPENAAEQSRRSADGGLLNFDVAFLRVYENGAPVNSSETFLRLSNAAPSEGQPVFVVGNPLFTQRHATSAELTLARATTERRLFHNYELRGVVLGYTSARPEIGAAAAALQYLLDVAIVDGRGAYRPFADPYFLFGHLIEADKFASKVKDDGRFTADFDDAQKRFASAIQMRNALFPAYYLLESPGLAFSSVLFGFARDLVRLSAEAAKPEAERIPGYREIDIPDVLARLRADEPIDADFEIAKLAFSLRKLADENSLDKSVKDPIFRGSTPDELARSLIRNTSLADRGERERLLAGGAKAITESHDPMISLFRDAIDGIARQVKTQYETGAGGAVFRERWRLNRIREAVYAEHTYPDATGSLRLSFGRVQGLEDARSNVPALSSIGSIFDSGSGTATPLPPSWLATRADLDGHVILDFLTSTDTIGGNSGSPVLDANGQVLGVLHGGTSAETYYKYDPHYRAISVSAAGLFELLRKTYHAQNLLMELAQR